jgi:hypothetical protein
MGILLIDKNADFSATSVGFAGICTSITSGLTDLFALRENNTKSTFNAAAGYDDALSTAGIPTYSANSAICSTTAQLSSQNAPTPGATDNTLIVVLKRKAGGSLVSDMAVGANVELSTNGGIYILNANYQVKFECGNYAAGSVPPLSGIGATMAAITTLASVAEFDLFAGISDADVGVKLYHPKTGTLVSMANTAGRQIIFDSPGNFKIGASAVAMELALFARWNRVLSTAEVDVFYADVLPQLAAVGISI